MEFAPVGDKDSAAGDVLTLSSARQKAADYKVDRARQLHTGTGDHVGDR
jgi:hypothetical protein